MTHHFAVIATSNDLLLGLAELNIQITSAKAKEPNAIVNFMDKKSITHLPSGIIAAYNSQVSAFFFTINAKMPLHTQEHSG